MVDDKRFDNFTYVPTGDMPPASAVTITGNVDPVTGAPGITINGAFSAVTQRSDAVIQYTVTDLDPARPITDVELLSNPRVIGTGSFSIEETFRELPNVRLSNFDQILGGVETFKNEDFANIAPIMQLHITKDIEGLPGPNSTAQASAIRQNFSQAPEPGSMVLFGIGLLGALGYGRRRRKASTA
jgi:hypothetical protein